MAKVEAVPQSEVTPNKLLGRILRAEFSEKKHAEMQYHGSGYKSRAPLPLPITSRTTSRALGRRMTASRSASVYMRPHSRPVLADDAVCSLAQRHVRVADLLEAKRLGDRD